METFVNLVGIFTPILILIGIDLLQADGRLRELIEECKRDRSTK